MRNTYLIPLIEQLKEHTNSVNAEFMCRYMKNKFPFLGIKTPERKQIVKNFIHESGWPKQEQLETIISELWSMPEREFQYFGIFFLDHFKNKCTQNFISVYENLVETKSWWDTVDGLAINEIGAYFKKFPKEINPVTREWMDSGNIWLQRSSLLFQHSYKKSTNKELLYNYIRELKHSKEFFIRKAIGWILREYSKSNPQSVIDFIETTDISNFSKKEALKHIERNTTKN
ncbi:MAG: DNA alkylation repair protein [Bacteroidales bacterium]|nr:DNA alkylation repair protein [Bacteroidales bacterium]